jgi:Ca2+-binding RTX toxin-like protein
VAGTVNSITTSGTITDLVLVSGTNNTVHIGDAVSALLSATGSTVAVIGGPDSLAVDILSLGTLDATVNAPNANPPNGAITITATPGNNTIASVGGRNIISTGPGDDTITTGPGDDTINAGGGTNTCDADGGSNLLFGC